MLSTFVLLVIAIISSFLLGFWTRHVAQQEIDARRVQAVPVTQDPCLR